MRLIFRAVGFLLAFSYVHSLCDFDVNRRVVCVHSSEKEFTTLVENLDKNVTELHFYNVQMGRLSKQMFDYPHLKSIHLLRMTNVHFDGIEDGTFNGYSNLREFAIVLNLGSLSIHPGTFRGAYNLETLLFSYASLTNIDIGSFVGLSSLQELDILQENITSLRTGNFLGLTDLNYLSLEGTAINHIAPGAFTGLGSLEELYLSSNEITNIQEGVFNGLHELKYLDLSRNSLGTLNYAIFKGLDNVHWLDLSLTGIKHVDEQELRRYMPKLDKVIIT